MQTWNLNILFGNVSFIEHELWSIASYFFVNMKLSTVEINEGEELD